ncbi:MAG TPA: HipA family kinase [Gemmatimonadaceae bacterium]|nr:HipA family kinase [Gemmatimonadaceae bacterium]
MTELPILTATRYVQPLREGGSLPAVVEMSSGDLFVVKFRGAGQGAKALVAELIAGLLARALDLPTPELAIVEVPPPFGRSEPDPEIQDLLRASHGVNVGVRYLNGAFNFDPGAAGDLVSAELAARIVWFDALLTNPDRTHRNPNILVWERKPWLIDHGAALYAHHDWSSVNEARTRSPFTLVKQHVLLAQSGDLAAADAAMSKELSADVVDGVLAAIPDALLAAPPLDRDAPSPDVLRERYRSYLLTRLRSPRDFVSAAISAREQLLSEPPRRLSARR